MSGRSSSGTGSAPSGLWIPLLMGLGLIAFVIFDDINQLRPRLASAGGGPAAGAGLAFGLAASAGIAWQVARSGSRPRHRDRLTWWTAIAVLVLFFGVRGWGAAQPRHPAYAAAVGTEIAVWLGIAALAVYGLFTHRRRERAKLRPGYPHAVTVWDVRPYERDDFTPYFVAHCTCDWLSDPHDAGEPDAGQAAFAEARTHTDQVDPVVHRPLA